MAYQRFKTAAQNVSLDFGELNPKQKLFTQARTKYIAYGGARGGGKTHVARVKAAMGAIGYPGIRILFVRREYPELEQTVIIPMRKMLPDGLCAYNGTMHMFSFANGSIIKFGHFGANDELEYQGQEYDWIFMDEATQFTEDQFLILCACLRGANKVPKRVYLTCNPGGVGHFWVKRLFVTKEYQKDEHPREYTFIKATVRDNPQLMEHNPDYVRQLERQPPDRRAAWLDGDWDAMSGAFFPEVTESAHRIKDLWKVPAAWRKYRVFDYGLDMLACLWIAVDCDGRAYVYRELGMPDLTVSDAAEEILSLTPPGESIDANIAPPDMWSRTKDSGKTMAEMFAENGLPILKASNNRIQGWMALKEALKPLKSEEDRPGLLFCESCRQVFDNIKSIQHSEKDPNDCSTAPHDITHFPDALRYFAVTRLMIAERPVEREEPELERVRLENYDDAMTGGDVDEGYLNY